MSRKKAISFVLAVTLYAESLDLLILDDARWKVAVTAIIGAGSLYLGLRRKS